MTGMSMMSDAVAPLAGVPEFTGILTLFSNPILGMLCGALLTGIIQSSAASIGILQALCVTDAITYSTALPIIMVRTLVPVSQRCCPRQVLPKMRAVLR